MEQLREWLGGGFLHHYPPAWLEQMIKRLVDLGLDALEVWHTEHSEDAVNQALAWAKKFNLGVSGGSDYHGDRKPDVHLGIGRGNLHIPRSTCLAVQKSAKPKGLFSLLCGLAFYTKSVLNSKNGQMTINHVNKLLKDLSTVHQ